VRAIGEFLLFLVAILAIHAMAWVFWKTGTSWEEARLNVVIGVVAGLLARKVVREVTRA
jgi:hypothetical protein